MSSTEQLYMVLVLAAFVGFMALAAFLSFSEYRYDSRQRHQSLERSDAIAIRPGAKAA